MQLNNYIFYCKQSVEKVSI